MGSKEQSLLKRVRASDSFAFKELFYDFHDSLFRFTVYRVHDEDIAEDITQETFIRVWKNRKKLQPTKSFFSLIARISSNLCYDHFRHIKVRQRHKDSVPQHGDSHFDNPEAGIQADVLQAEIQRIVNAKLPEKCRIIFILSRINGMANPEIATELDLSIRTVENQIYRALKILKKNLKNYL